MTTVAVMAGDRQWGISVSGHVAEFGGPLYSMLDPTPWIMWQKGSAA